MKGDVTQAIGMVDPPTQGGEPLAMHWHLAVVHCTTGTEQWTTRETEIWHQAPIDIVAGHQPLLKLLMQGMKSWHRSAWRYC